MRAYEFLVEYRRDVTLQNYSDKLSAITHDPVGFVLKTNPEDLLSKLEDCDPTKNKQYMIWIVKQYINKKFRYEDQHRIKSLLTDYEKLKPRLPQEQRDINRFDLHQLEEIVDRIMNPDIGTSDAVENGIYPVVQDSEVLYNGPLGQLAIPKTEEASCELGRGTKWCTAGKEYNQFNYYNRQGPLYVWRDRNGEKYQIHFPSMQFADARDANLIYENTTFVKNFFEKHPIGRQLNKQLIELAESDPLAVIFRAKVFNDVSPESIKLIASDPRSAFEYAFWVLQDRWPEAEKVIADDPFYARSYAYFVIKGRWPEAEKVIARDPNSAAAYAKQVIKGRWPEAEKVIARDPSSAYNYAKEVIKGRWPEAEKVIARDPSSAYSYANEVIKGRWPEAEKVIARDPYYACLYARDVIKGRYPKAEKVIASEPFLWAMKYAKEVIKGRWPELEKLLVSDPFTAMDYANEVIKGRWPELEKLLVSDPYYAPYYAYLYARDVIKGRWPEAENVIVSDPYRAKNYAKEVIKDDDPESWRKRYLKQNAKNKASDPLFALIYARDIKKGRWPEGEKAIASDPKTAYEYARSVIKGRWPEAEKKIAKNPKYAYKYARHVIKGRFPQGEAVINQSRRLKNYYERYVLNNTKNK